jgi:hypothetical protein
MLGYGQPHDERADYATQKSLHLSVILKNR